MSKICVHVENSSHHHQHSLSRAVQFYLFVSGTKAHSLTTAQCSCHFNIPDRCLNGNVTRNTTKRDKKKPHRKMCVCVDTNKNVPNGMDARRVRVDHLMLVSTIFMQLHFAQSIISTFLCENGAILFFLCYFFPFALFLSFTARQFSCKHFWSCRKYIYTHGKNSEWEER